MSGVGSRRIAGPGSCVVAAAVLLLTSADAARAVEMSASLSIAGFDRATGEIGVIVGGSGPACGNDAPWVQAGVGAIALGGDVDPALGPLGLALLRAGMPAGAVADSLLRADPGFQRRQVGVLDREGNPGGYTGLECLGWSGGMLDTTFAAQGNSLARGVALDSARAVYLRHRDRPLAERLLGAFRAGQAAGGDRRGLRSAALLVGRPHPERPDYASRYVYLRVDDHADPFAELLRLYAEYAAARIVPARLDFLAHYRSTGQGARVRSELGLVRRAATRALADTALSAQALNAMAWGLASHGEALDLAEAAVSAAIERDDGRPEFLDTAAEVSLRAGRYDEAVERSKRAAILAPQDEGLRERHAGFVAARDRARSEARPAPARGK